MSHELLDNVVIWFFVLLAGSWTAALAYPLYRRVSAGSEPVDRAALLFIYAATPVAAALLVMVLLANPELASALVPGHCHADACGPHTPEITFASHLGVALAAMVVGALTLAVVAGIRTLRKLAVRLNILSHFSEHDRTTPYSLVDSPDPIAWCVGAIRPRIYLSRGLVHRLTPTQLQAVLTHESVHRERRDNLRRTLVSYATMLWLPIQRRELQKDFSDATERACDAITVVRVPDLKDLAEVKAVLTDFDPGVSAVNTQAAIAQPQSTLAIPGTAGWLFISALWLLEVVMFTGWTHLALEWVTR